MENCYLRKQFSMVFSYGHYKNTTNLENTEIVANDKNIVENDKEADEESLNV